MDIYATSCIYIDVVPNKNEQKETKRILGEC
jgi:hypothetical protein